MLTRLRTGQFTPWERARMSRLMIGAVVLIALTSATFELFCSDRAVRAAASVDAKQEPNAVQDEDAVIVLKDGTEVTGKIAKEDDVAVYVRSVFGTQKILRSKIKEIRRGKSPLRDEFETRFTEGVKRKSARLLNELGQWAGEKGLAVEAIRAFEKVIELDSEDATAREALGHARLDGKWIDAKRVRELLGQGYVRDGMDLKPGTKTADPERGRTGVSKKAARALSILGALDPAETKKRDAERRSRATSFLAKFDKYMKRKRAEHQGVSWSSRHKVSTSRYNMNCDVAPDSKVARVYAWVMDDLYRALSQRIKGKDQHRVKSPVFIYKTHEEFMEETGMPAGVGGFFRRDTGEIRAYHGTFGSTGTTFAVLAHEGTHQFQKLKLPQMGNMPQWLTEGMAVYYGDGSRLDQRRKKIITSLIPRDRLLHLQDKIASGRQTDLKTLVRIPDGRLDGSNYADAWSLCYFLFDGPNLDDGRKFIGRYWMAAKERKILYSDFTALADRYFGGMKKMEAEWTEYTKGLIPEPVGAIRGDRIESYDFKFNWNRTNEGWQWKTGKLDNDALIALEIPKTGVECRLAMRSKPYRQSNEEFGDSLVQGLERSGAYGVPKLEPIDFFGIPVLKFTFSKPVPEENDDEKKKELSPAEKKKAAEEAKKKAEELAKKGPPKKYGLYVFPGFNRAYYLWCQAPEDQFDELEGHFEELAKEFEMVPENRW